VPDDAPDDAHLTGYLIAPSSRSVTTWSLFATQDSTHLGRAWADHEAPIQAGAIVASDLILGAEAQGLAWSLPTTAVILAPLDAMVRTDPLELYYQVISDAERSGVKTSIALYQASGGPRSGAPALQVSFDTDLHRGINEIDRQIDVSRLEPGSYELEMSLSSDDGRVNIKRMAALRLK
jgi:hypothetical protein